VNVSDVNKLLKQFDDMADMMKRMQKLGPKGLMRHGMAGLMPNAGAGRGPSGPRRPF
jgi:signal recognition particle subunit SRP54